MMIVFFSNLINIFYYHAVLYTTYFKILNNLYLSTKNSSTEIDVVTIHETGIYVFESKNFSGWIYGGYKQKEWTQKLEHFQNHFYNPIWQNKGHISALKNVFHLSKWMKCI